jgi:hypothetical protein
VWFTSTTSDCIGPLPSNAGIKNRKGTEQQRHKAAERIAKALCLCAFATLLSGVKLPARRKQTVIFFCVSSAFSGSQGGYNQVFRGGGLDRRVSKPYNKRLWSEGGEKLASFSVELFPGQKMDGCIVRISAHPQRGVMCAHIRKYFDQMKSSGRRTTIGGEGRYEGNKKFQIQTDLFRIQGRFK